MRGKILSIAFVSFLSLCACLVGELALVTSINLSTSSVTYALYRGHDTPVFRPVMALLSLAFADNAFKDSKPEEHFSLTVPDFKEPLAIRWRSGCPETPVFFRRVNGVICHSTPMGIYGFQALSKASRLSCRVSSGAKLLCTAQGHIKCRRLYSYPWWSWEEPIFANAI